MGVVVERGVVRVIWGYGGGGGSGNVWGRWWNGRCDGGGGGVRMIGGYDGGGGSSGMGDWRVAVRMVQGEVAEMVCVMGGWLG